MNKPEIVAPGGSYSKAMVAASYGAESVYLGVPFTSLRMRQNKIATFDEVKKTIDDLHAIGTKAFLTMNIFPRNKDIQLFEQVVEQIAELGADGIIFSDPGTLHILKKYLPDTPLHLSTQASTLNWAAVKFWYEMGVSRIVTARELHIDEIKEIKKHVPEMEIEVFVHGAMCMSYSGRCLLGDYMSGRPGNRGECSHACRFKYKVWVEEERRPGKLYQLDESEGGTYIMSSKDLCTIDRLAEILPYVDAIKIEGRSKSEFYVGAMVKAYGHVRDAILEGKEPDTDTKDLVNQIPHREYRDGFLFNELQDFPETEAPKEERQSHTTKKSPGPIGNRNNFGLFFPETIEKDGKTYHKFNPKENILRGDKIKYLSPSGMGTLEIVDILGPNGDEIEKATCNNPEVYILTDIELTGWELLYKDLELL